MMRTWARLAALAVGAVGPSVILQAAPPVLTFFYETARGIELDEEEELEPSYVRHTFLTSVRQSLGDQVRVVLPLRVTTRLDPQDQTEGERRTVSFQPLLNLDLSDRFDLGTELILRRHTDPRFVTAGGRLRSRLRLGEVTIDGWLKPLFDTYAVEPERNRQLHTATLGLTFTRDAVRLSTRYRGTARFPFGEASEVEPRFSHLVNMSLRVDLAKVE